RVSTECYRNRRPPDPPEPGFCCGTGCENCVWLNYADAVFDYYLSQFPQKTDSGQISRIFLKIRGELAKAADPAVRSLLLMELAKKYEKAQRGINKPKL
ncbi:hypothetical protein FBUS_09445, partial [Fasciolopsis buskii]